MLRRFLFARRLDISPFVLFFGILGYVVYGATHPARLPCPLQPQQVLVEDLYDHTVVHVCTWANHHFDCPAGKVIYRPEWMP